MRYGRSEEGTEGLLIDGSTVGELIDLLKM